jgi:hypothetical protein
MACLTQPKQQTEAALDFLNSFRGTKGRIPSKCFSLLTDKSINGLLAMFTTDEKQRF